jgi:hypothetical protein
LLHASAISRLICITTASMLSITMSRLQRAAMPDRCVSMVPAIWSISSLTSSCRTSLRCFSPILMRSNAAFAKARSASPQLAAIAAAHAASIAGRQPGSGRVGSRHLAAGSRPRCCASADWADGRGLCGLPSGESRLGDGRSITADGFSHRVRFCCVAVG